MAEQLAGMKPQSQFGRALKELGVDLIAAHSPQAKGRVERLFKTFQDRLSKEMRLARIATLEGANRFLEHYLPVYNRRFMVPPAQVTDLHRPKPPVRDLDRCLCLKTTRCLRKDFTIAHAGQLYQIHDTIRARHVLVEQRLDEIMRLTHQGRPLNFHAIAGAACGGGETTASLPPLRHAEAESSVAQAVAARTRTIDGGDDTINWTFLLWEKENISKLG